MMHGQQNVKKCGVW